MKLLVIAQIVDKTDPGLSFFHVWLEEFAKKFGHITVICLKEGKHELPQNVKVLSLGKESGQSRFTYISRFYKYIWQEKDSYDAVFVHMNQEYILLAGIIWKMLKKPVYMWRNHYSGSFLTDIAASFTAKVFCTSKYSYTAKYRNTVIMPVGVDTAIFKPDTSISRIPRSILFLSRISPSKKLDQFIRGLNLLKNEEVEFTATVIGDALPADAAYLESAKERARDWQLQSDLTFKKGVPNIEAPAQYSSHEICANLSRSGMYDKTMFEAMACGAILLACNKDLKGQIDERCIFEEDNERDFAEKLKVLLNLSAADKKLIIGNLGAFVEKHSLSKLGSRLKIEMEAAL